MESWEQVDKPLHDLIEIIHFTENVSTKIHGVLDDAEIYRIVSEEFAKSQRYTMSIVLLTDDESKLRIAETSLPPEKLKAGEKASGFQLKGYEVDLNKSSIYSQVVREGKTLQVNVSDVIGELFPRPLASLISKIMGYEGKKSILTPLKRHGKIIGVFAMSSTELAEHFIPSVRNLALHISTALELADAHAESRRAEEELRKYHDYLEELVEERTTELMQANEQLQREITERKRAEEALRSAHRKLRAAFEAIQENMNVVDLDFRLTDVNDTLIRVFGLPDKESSLGRKCFEVLKGRKDICPYCAVAEAYRTKAPVYRTTTPEEEVLTGGRSFEIFAYPIIDEHGNLSGAVEFARDITERKRAGEELRQSYVKLQRTLGGTVHALVSAIEMRDPYTAGHQRRVTQLACAIAKEMGLPEERIEGLRMAGLIHDLGKINVPAEILSKPAQLTELEYGLIQAHSQVGHDVLNGTIEFPWPVAQIVLQHHERMDGSGYPQGLSGEEIILEARILGVADVVEAMASHRPYRSARGIDEALQEISANRGVLYDPEVVDACLKLFTEKGFKFG